MTPEAFLAGYPPLVQELAYQLRTVVKEAVPEFNEQVYRGRRASCYPFQGRKSGVEL